jgi:hypothetical protein
MKAKKKNGVQYLKSVMTEEDYQNILRGSSVAQGEKIKAGLFISVAKDELQKVKENVFYLTKHEDKYVRGTAKNILKEAEKNASWGMFGDGMFLAE